MNPNRKMESLNVIPACAVSSSSTEPTVVNPVVKVSQKPLKDIQRNIDKLRYPGKIKPECIALAMSRSDRTLGYSCNGQEDHSPQVISQPVERIKTDLAGNEKKENVVQGPCISNNVVNHVTWVVNQALMCMGSLDMPISPELVFRKFNDETAFHYYKAYDGGVGIGQTTTSAVRQVLSDNTPLYQKFQASKSSACATFQKYVSAAEKQLETQQPSSAPLASEKPKPSKPTAGKKSAGKPSPARARSPSAVTTAPPKPAVQKPVVAGLEKDNWCNLISTTGGFAANTMISLIYFAHIRSAHVEKEVTEILNRGGITDLSQQQRFVDLATLARYGAGGKYALSQTIELLKSTMKNKKGSPNFANAVWEGLLARAEGQNENLNPNSTPSAGKKKKSKPPKPESVAYLKQTRNKADEALRQANGLADKIGNFKPNSTADCVEPVQNVPSEQNQIMASESQPPAG